MLAVCAALTHKHLSGTRKAVNVLTSCDSGLDLARTLTNIRTAPRPFDLMHPLQAPITKPMLRKGTPACPTKGYSGVRTALLCDSELVHSGLAWPKNSAESPRRQFVKLQVTDEQAHNNRFNRRP